MDFNIPSTLGERIKYLRMRKGYNQEVAAGFMGISQPYLHKIENNIGIPSLKFLQYICEFLEIDMDLLLHNVYLEKYGHKWLFMPEPPTI